jgi:hypothetical protein
MFGGWEALEASPMQGRCFEHQTKGFKISSVRQPAAISY